MNSQVLGFHQKQLQEAMMEQEPQEPRVSKFKPMFIEDKIGINMKEMEVKLSSFEPLKDQEDGEDKTVWYLKVRYQPELKFRLI